MLVLTRKVSQVIKIGDDIEVTVLGLQDGCVRLAVAAPKHIAVDRAEIRAAKIANPRTEGARHVAL